MSGGAGLGLRKSVCHMRPPEAPRPGRTGWPKGHLEHIAMNALVLLTVLAAGVCPKELVA